MCTACSFDGYSRFRPDRRQLQHVVVLAGLIPQQLVRPLGAEVARRESLDGHIREHKKCILEHRAQQSGE